jgi:hypothetical protein
LPGQEYDSKNRKILLFILHSHALTKDVENLQKVGVVFLPANISVLQGSGHYWCPQAEVLQKLCIEITIETKLNSRQLQIVFAGYCFAACSLLQKLAAVRRLNSVPLHYWLNKVTTVKE